MQNLCEKRVCGFLASLLPVSMSAGFESTARLEQAIERWARVDVGRGDLVLISLPNTIDQIVEFFAALLSNATPAVLPPGLPTGRIAKLISTYAPRALVSARNYKVGGTSFSELENHKIVRVYPKTGQPRFHDVLLFTSGTSGHLSACSFSLEKLLMNARYHTESIGRTTPEIIYLSLPIYYSFALVAQVLGSYITGSRLVVGSSPFNIADFVRAVSENQIAGASLTPILAKRLLASERAADLELEFLTIGGDQANANDVRQLLERLPKTELFITYGLTEAGPRVSTLAAHSEDSDKLASVGKPFDHISAGVTMPNAEGVGELLLATPTMAETVFVDGVASDHKRLLTGELMTGDLFRIEDGYLFFCGRKSDFIVCRGEKVNLRSVRQLACEYPNVCGAKTSIVSSGASSSYILTVQFKPGSEPSTREFDKHLGSVLRRSEFPTEIVAETAIEGVPENLKV